MTSSGGFSSDGVGKDKRKISVKVQREAEGAMLCRVQEPGFPWGFIKEGQKVADDHGITEQPGCGRFLYMN